MIEMVREKHEIGEDLTLYFTRPNPNKSFVSLGNGGTLILMSLSEAKAVAKLIIEIEE